MGPERFEQASTLPLCYVLPPHPHSAHLCCRWPREVLVLPLGLLATLDYSVLHLLRHRCPQELVPRAAEAADGHQSALLYGYPSLHFLLLVHCGARSKGDRFGACGRRRMLLPAQTARWGRCEWTRKASGTTTMHHGKRNGRSGGGVTCSSLKRQSAMYYIPTGCSFVNFLYSMIAAVVTEGKHYCMYACPNVFVVQGPRKHCGDTFARSRVKKQSTPSHSSIAECGCTA